MVTRISGFSSGLDIDDLVKKLMATKKEPLNKLNQQKTKLEWQRDEYRNINSKLVDFRNNKLFNYGLSSSISAKQAVVTGNTSAVSVRAGSTALTGNMSIEVVDLAKAATLQSGDGANGGIGQVDPSKSLAELKAMNTASGGSLRFDYTSDATGNVTFQINGKDVTVNEADSLNSVIQKINNDSSLNVTAYLDNQTGKMSITSKTTGVGTVTASGAFMDNFFLAGLSTDPNTAVSTTGSDANVRINGILTTRSSNTFTENGVEFTLNAPSSGVASKIEIKSNTDKIMDTIKSFISDYNSLLESVNNKVNEQRYLKYPPLTEEQRKEMDEDEIKLWEEKAKSGMLRNDPTLSAIASNMRLASITDVMIDGKKVNITSFGISTGNYTDRGKLVIQNEDKLREAIEKDPDAVIGFFTQQTAETDPKKKTSATNPDNGLFNRLSNIVMTGLDALATKAGTSKFSADLSTAFQVNSLMGDQLRELDKRIDEMNDRLNMWETQYYKQFTAMETAMNRYSSQSSSLFG